MTGGKGTLLLVEDEKPALELLRKILEGEGFRILTAGNGREALDRLEEQVVDVVITDLEMPVMTGADLLTQIQALADPPPVIVVTAHGSKEAGRHLVNRQLMVDKAAGIFRKKGDSCRIGESTLCVVWRDRHSSNE